MVLFLCGADLQRQRASLAFNKEKRSPSLSHGSTGIGLDLDPNICFFMERALRVVCFTSYGFLAGEGTFNE